MHPPAEWCAAPPFQWAAAPDSVPLLAALLQWALLPLHMTEYLTKCRHLALCMQVLRESVCWHRPCK